MQTEAVMIAMARTNVDGVALAAEDVVVDVMAMVVYLWLRPAAGGGRAAVMEDNFPPLFLFYYSFDLI